MNVHSTSNKSFFTKHDIEVIKTQNNVNILWP